MAPRFSDSWRSFESNVRELWLRMEGLGGAGTIAPAVTRGCTCSVSGLQATPDARADRHRRQVQRNHRGAEIAGDSQPGSTIETVDALKFVRRQPTREAHSFSGAASDADCCRCGAKAVSLVVHSAGSERRLASCLMSIPRWASNFNDGRHPVWCCGRCGAEATEAPAPWRQPPPRWPRFCCFGCVSARMFWSMLCFVSCAVRQSDSKTLCNLCGGNRREHR